MNNEVNYIIRIICQHQIKNVSMDVSGLTNQLTEIKVKYNFTKLSRDW